MAHKERRNPYPGKLFNTPDAKDVYKSLHVDYRGRDVTVQNIIAVMTGNRTAVRGGNGRVLERFASIALPCGNTRRI